MKRATFASLGLTAMLLSLGSAHATTYYVSDCQPGAHARCVAGNDSNDGKSAALPWRTAGEVSRRFGGLVGGDKVLFARGGVWTHAAMRLQNLVSSATSPITLDSYAPSWGGSARPILKEARTETILIAFDDGGVPEPDGGYVVQNLDLRGEGSGMWGIFTSQLTSDITLRNLNIEGFGIGIHCGVAIERVRLLESTLTNNRGQGVLWGCANSSIENNVFDNNGWEVPVLDHAIYLNSDDGGTVNNVIRGNVLTNSGGPNGRCVSVPLVVHGKIDGLLIENNLIQQAAGTSTEGCWGIAVDSGYGTPEWFRRVVIRANTVVNVGGIAIGCAACTAPVIENNVVIQEAGPVLVGIQVPDRQRAGDDTADSAAIVRNNSIYFGAPVADSRGIMTARNGSSGPGSNLQVVSNLVWFGAGHNNHYCFDTSGTVLSDYAEFNNNLCHHAAANNGRYSTTYASLADAKRAGFDAAGLAVNPQLVALPSQANNWMMALSAGSPALNVGHATRSATTDRRLVTRSNVADIGAFEWFTDTLSPASPANFVMK